jgi:thiol-disulfide isomerase/thioredoxin
MISMRQILALITVLTLLVSSCNRGSEEIFYVPITIKPEGLPVKDFGSYYNLYESPVYSGILSKARPAFKNIPAGFEHAHLGVIHHDIPQLYFQEYKKGTLDATEFRKAFKAWNLDTLSEQWSEKPILVSTHFLVDTTNRNQPRVIVDTNCNLDFGDEEIRLLVVKNNDTKARRDSALTLFETFYETIVNGKVKRLPFKFRLWEEVVWFAPMDGPEPDLADLTKWTETRWLTGRGETYAQATFKEQILLFPDHNSRFRNTNMFILKAPGDSLPNLGTKYAIASGDYFNIGASFYRYDGVDLSRMAVKIARVRDTTGFRTAQVGFKAPDFAGTDFLTQKPVSATSLRGKFVFLDFWGSWCGPCRGEYYNLIQAHSSIDTSKVAFLGIAYDNADSLRKYLGQKPTPWQNIHQADELGLVKSFRVTGYPTTFIIDPNGIIVQKNPWTKVLADTLNAMVKRWPWPQPVSVTSASSPR